MSENATEKLYNKREAASVLRCSEITIHRLLKQKRLGHYRIASKVLIGEHHIFDYLAQEERQAKKGHAA